MYKHAIVCGLMVWFVSASAFGDAVAVLVPDAPSPYTPGQVVSVAINFISDEADTVYMRMGQMSLSNTDPTIDILTFDFVDASPLYAAFPALPMPSIVWTGTEAIPDLMISYVPGVPATLATVGVAVNDTGTLDMFPASLGFGFGVDPDDPIVTWDSEDGTLTGGTLEMVVPEPMSLGILAVGAILLARRRNRGNRRS